MAVEAVRQDDLDALERGLAKLYQADPAVEISVQESGEHVITALGELHLEQCIKVRKRHRDNQKRAGQRRVARPTKQSNPSSATDLPTDVPTYLSRKDLRECYARVEVRASTPLVVFRESVAQAASAQAEPVQLSLPPWSEEEGASASSRGVCRLVTSSGDCRITVRCFALQDRLAQLLDTHPYEVRALVSELAHDAGTALAGRGEGAEGPRGIEGDEEEAGMETPLPKGVGEQQGPSSMRTLSRISQDGGGVGGGAEAARRPFREQVEDALVREGVEPIAEGGGAPVPDAAAAAPAAGAQRLTLGSVLAFGPRNVGPNALFLPLSFGVRLLWSTAGEEADRADAGEREDAEVAVVDPPAVAAWARSVAWPSLQSSLLVGFQMATASGTIHCDERPARGSSLRHKRRMNCTLVPLLSRGLSSPDLLPFLPPFSHPTTQGPLAEEQMYGVGFEVQEVALLLKGRELGTGGGDGGAPPVPLCVDDLKTWLTARLGSLTGQVMSSSKVDRW